MYILRRSPNRGEPCYGLDASSKNGVCLLFQYIGWSIIDSKKGVRHSLPTRGEDEEEEEEEVEDYNEVDSSK